MNIKRSGKIRFQRFTRMGAILATLACSFWIGFPPLVYGQGDIECQESGPYYLTNVYSCPAVTNNPGVFPGSFCETYGSGVSMPTVTPPAYSEGRKFIVTTYDCDTNSYTNWGDITYSVGPVVWDPPLPGTVTSSFSSTAKVWVTSDLSNYCAPTVGDPVWDIGTNGWVTIGSCSWGYNSCDNPHEIQDTAYECAHVWNATNGTPCDNSEVIKDVIDVYACTFYSGATCPSNCRYMLDPFQSPCIEQYVFTADCSAGEDFDVDFQPWHIVFTGCSTCQGIQYSVACVAGPTTGPLVSGPVGRGILTVPCN